MGEAELKQEEEGVGEAELKQKEEGVGEAELKQKEEVVGEEELKQKEEGVGEAKLKPEEEVVQPQEVPRTAQDRRLRPLQPVEVEPPTQFRPLRPEQPVYPRFFRFVRRPAEGGGKTRINASSGSNNSNFLHDGSWQYCIKRCTSASYNYCLKKNGRGRM